MGVTFELVEPSHVGLDVPDTYPAIFVAQLPSRRIEVLECGESLEPVRISSFPWYANNSWPHSAPTVLVRQGVNSRLVSAEHTLPSGFSLVVMDGWRDRRLQQALHDHFTVEGVPTGYVSDPDSSLYVPPHVTGGAVDLTLAWNGTPLALGTQFDEFGERSWPQALENDADPGPERTLRRLLTAALVAQGFCPHPMEWWHFSFGDQIWAANFGVARAIYDQIEPVLTLSEDGS